MGLITRKAKASDSDAVFELVKNFSDEFPSDADAFCRAYTKVLEAEDSLLHVAEREGEVIGYCLAVSHYTFYAYARVIYVEEIMVREDLRAHGIGQALMERVENWAEDKKARFIGLSTQRAAPFWHSLGYKEQSAFYSKHLA